MRAGLIKLIFCYLLFLVLPGKQLKAQNNFGGYLLLSGEIISPANTQIEGVHILNTNTNTLSITDEYGFFSLTMHKSHVLRISSIGFKTYYYTLKNQDRNDISYVKITLQTVTVGLKNVDIVAEEEQRSENMFRPKPIPAPFSFGYQGEQHKVKASALNPVSLLYNWLSKEGKQNRKLEELLKQDEIKKLVAGRYESDLIWELTGYAGEELERFKDHCNLSDYFVANSSDYEFLLNIKECYNSYIPD
ncbi:MAG: carboxypeptidase-like regulatory domain-containing protein [Cyclobacteriaceae bacterium]|nr:carboxypeptidase-like regulatory domain-containing protein [Cyclobacteriaceae bacterium]